MFKTELAKKNWEGKYQYNNETPLETQKRVAKAVASVEKNPEEWEDKFLKVLVKFDDKGNPIGLKNTFGGRITANIGTEYNGTTLLNCFVGGAVSNAHIHYERSVPGTDKKIDVTYNTESTPDNLANIMLTLLEQAETLKSEGGYGLNFDFIRPRGSPIKSIGIKHPGVVHYMEIWDTVASVIVMGDNDGYKDTIKNYIGEKLPDKVILKMKKQSRKGAQLAALSVWHPDIEEFIRAKQEKGKLTKFNMSVLVDDKFMEAVEKDDFYDLHFSGKVYKKVKALDLYNLMMKSSYSRNEPGILFYDSMQKNNPISYMGYLNATNPSLRWDTLVSTDKGVFQIKHLAENEKNIKVINIRGEWQHAYVFQSGKNKQLYKILFSDKSFIYCTAEHKWPIVSDINSDVENMNKVETKDLKVGNKFYKPNFNNIFKNTDEKLYKIIENIEATDIYEDVYDITVYDDTHTFMCEGGIITSNCGEVGGNPNTSTVCMLGSVNLTQYVNKDRSFDFNQYEKDVKIFTRMLDNINDITNAPLPQYRWAAKNIRQFGMGINGLGSCLYMMGLKYNSKESYDFIEKITAMKEDITWKTSALLAKEKGVFPAYNEKFLETNWFTKFTRISEETKNLIRQYGVRNAKTSTNPPNGNAGIICDIVSNGIEPVFEKEYYRTYVTENWPDGYTKNNIKSALKEEKQGDAIVWTGEINGVRYLFEPHNRGLCIIESVRDYGYQWVIDNYPDDIKNKAPYLIGARDIDLDGHINVQAIIQRNCSQSVSKTINLPANFTLKAYKDLYLKAWKEGLNGITTYREGSMESVLSVVEKNNGTREIIKKDIKLPDVFINGPMQVFKKEHMKFYMHFSYLPEDINYIFPIAMWINTNSFGEIRESNAAVKELIGLLEQFQIESSLIEKQKEKIKDNPGHQRTAKMISMCLRHNIPIVNIVHALGKIKDIYVTDTIYAVKKFLSEKITNGTPIMGVKCSVCKSSKVVYSGGCSVCQDCGASGCE